MNPSEIIPASQTPEARLTTIPAYHINLGALRAALKANLGVGGMALSQLPQIKVPTGGGLQFEINDMDGEKHEKTVVGIILAAKHTRAYWPKSLSQGSGNERPQCHSNDAIVGIGNPGGKCIGCPMAQYGTAVRDGQPARGQACKEMMPLFILRSGAPSLLPENLTLPPTSLNDWKTFRSQATTQVIDGEPSLLHRFVIEFGLKRKEGSPPYSVVTYRRLARLSGPEYDRITEIRNLYAEYLEAPDAMDASEAAAYYDNPNPDQGDIQEDDGDKPF